MGFADLFFDRRCKICNERISKGAICPDCDKKLAGILQIRRYYINLDGKELEVLYLFDYEHPIVKKLLFALKRNADRELFMYAAELYGRMLCDINDAGVVFAPRRGVNKRNYGYDHMQKISKLLCKASVGRLKYAPLIKRKHFTKEQKNLDFEKRKKNVEHAFKITKNDIPKNIVLVDDVITTGNTVLSCSRVILNRRSDAEIKLAFLASAGSFTKV